MSLSLENHGDLIHNMIIFSFYHSDNATMTFFGERKALSIFPSCYSKAQVFGKHREEISCRPLLLSWTFVVWSLVQDDLPVGGQAISSGNRYSTIILLRRQQQRGRRRWWWLLTRDGTSYASKPIPIFFYHYIFLFQPTYHSSCWIFSSTKKISILSVKVQKMGKMLPNSILIKYVYVYITF